MDISSSIPQTQRAWRVLRQGSPSDVLELQSNVPVLSDLDENEVLLKVKSAALNPVGYKLMKLVPDIFASRPYTAEYDFSGIIVHQKGTRFQIGDEVFGHLPARPSPPKGQGSLSKYFTINGNQVAYKPQTISFDEAAGLSLATRTAIDALLSIADIKKGQTVFINGGSSGVGVVAIQIAKAYSCRVVASCSGRNVDFVKGLGADEVIDYTKTPLLQYFTEIPPTPKYDVCFDAVGSWTDLYLQSESFLTPQGIFVTTGPGVGAKPSLSNIPWLVSGALRTFFQPTWLGGVSRKFKICRVWPDGRDVPRMEKLVEEGIIKPVIDSVYVFEDALKAYERMMSGRAVGKVVVQVEA